MCVEWYRDVISIMVCVVVDELLSVYLLKCGTHLMKPMGLFALTR